MTAPIGGAWTIAKLGDWVTFHTGKLNSNAAKSEGKYPFFTCSQETLLTDTFSFDTECVLLAGNNANGIYPLKYFKGKFDAYQRTYVIRSADSKRLANRFLYYALFPKLEHLQSISTGAATKFLTLTLLRDVTFQQPPIEIQEHIAQILSGYDDLIENNTRRIKILEQMAQMLYREWFVNFRFPGHEKVTMVESVMGLIPEGWEAKRMDEVAEVIDCLHTKKPEHEENGTGLLLQLFNIGENGKIDLSKKFLVNVEVYKLWTSRIEVCAGDCVITNVGRIAAVGQIPVGTNAALGRNMTGIRPKKISPTFLLEYLLSPTMADEVAKKKDAGAIMDSLNVKGIIRLSVPVPPDKLMNEFELKGRPIRRQVEALMRKNQILRTTRDLLLPKLVSGEISVETLEQEALAATV